MLPAVDQLGQAETNSLLPGDPGGPSPIGRAVGEEAEPTQDGENGSRNKAS